MSFLQFSLAGFDDFLAYFAASIVFVAIFLAIYVRVTPYREIAHIREGNVAAAASLVGSVLGFTLPLSSAVIHSVNIWDMGLWAVIALAVQLLVYAVVRMAVPDIGRQIPDGKLASGIFLGGTSLAAGILNAACMTY